MYALWLSTRLCAGQTLIFHHKWDRQSLLTAVPKWSLEFPNTTSNCHRVPKCACSWMHHFTHSPWQVGFGKNTQNDEGWRLLASHASPHSCLAKPEFNTFWQYFQNKQRLLHKSFFSICLEVLTCSGHQRGKDSEQEHEGTPFFKPPLVSGQN